MDTEQRLQSAIAAARAGHRSQARRMLTEIVTEHPDHERAWLWLAGVIDDPDRQRWCLEQVLTRNPMNETARRAIAWLDRRTVPSSSARTPQLPRASTEIQASLPVLSPSPSPLPDEKELALRCPFCGASVAMEQRICPVCQRCLMEPLPVPGGNTASLSMLGGMWGAGGVFALAIGYALLDRSSIFFIPFVLGAGMLGMAIAVLRRQRWAYLAIGLALVPLVIFSWKYLFWPLLIPLILAYLRSYRNFYPRTRRIVPRLVNGDHEMHHKAAMFYHELEMWYIAVQEWQAALREQPANLLYRRGFARALLELRQFEQAALEYQKILMEQPDDESIRNMLQAIERKIRERQEQPLRGQPGQRAEQASHSGLP